MAEQQVATIEKKITFTPAGELTEIELTIGMVRRYLCKPTKNGSEPTDADIIGFMMLCKARLLNPWVSDAYLVGYDSKEGPSFTLITAAQSLLKRAELHGAFNGMESGVVIATKAGDIIERQGDITFDGEKLLGGWARVYRKDQEIVSYDALKLSTYNSGRSRWAADPAGMIVKCAESSSLRKAFPTVLAGLYTAEEMESVEVQAKTTNVRKLASVSANDPLAIQHEPAMTLEVGAVYQEQEPATVEEPARKQAKKAASVATDIYAPLDRELSECQSLDDVAQVEGMWQGPDTEAAMVKTLCDVRRKALSK